MNIKSIKANSIINSIRSILSIIFPLITFKYASSVLHIDNMGRYNFAASIISYFSLIAALGINAYAIRSGARIRDDREKIEKFTSEIFTLNIISTIISYCVLIVVINTVKDFATYKALILILSTQIFFKTIAVEWLYSIYEDYLFVTIRSIIIKVLALILVFVLVNDVDDVNQYAWVTVFASAGNGIIDYLFANKHCRIRLTKSINLKEHFIPILIIFAQNISLVIYVQSDTTLLGFLTSDYYTGLYSLSTNVYTGLKTVLCALVIVAIPRLSYYLGQNDINKFEKMIHDVFGYMMTFVFPIIVGVFMLSREAILLLSDESFLEADLSIKILCASTLFAMLSYIYGQCILLPLKKEKYILLSTVVSAIANVGLNFYFIPLMKHNGASITTLISEAIVFLISWAVIRKQVKIQNAFVSIMQPVIGVIPIMIICSCTRRFFGNALATVLVSVPASAIAYFIVELFLKNSLALELKQAFSKQLQKGKSSNDE